MDLTQFAYRTDSNTVQALLYLIQNIKSGFNANQCTVAALIDLEGAFDAVWRDGVVYQLHEAGVSGNLLLYIDSFLKDRYSRNLVNQYVSPWIRTEVGVPQGSIIAPILFIFYVRSMTRNIPDNIKYGDDLTAWRTHSNPDVAAASLSADIATVCEWNRKWRLMANPQKTEVLCFVKTGEIQVTVTLDNRVLKQVPVKLCLGIFLDQNLNFNAQASYAASKAIKATSKLGRFFHENGGVRAELGLSIYKTYIRPHLEYGYAAWCDIGTTAFLKLERAHRILYTWIL